MKIKRTWLIAGTLTLAMLGMLISFTSTFKSYVEKEKQNRIRSAAQLVSGSVTSSFTKPITVAKAMAEDISLREYLKEAEENSEDVEDRVSAYLTALRDGLGYNMMFAICDKSGAYYTCDGITSYIDKNYQGNCQWYGDFKNSGKEYDLNVDIEESTDWGLSVFVNQIVKDNNNNILGVCGTAVEMTQMQSLLEDYERVYEVKIDITDETGLIQVDTDVNRIQNDYLTLPDLSYINDGEFYYDNTGESDRVVAYLKDLDIYIVVEDTQSELDSFLPNLVIPIICCLLGAAVSTVILVTEKRGD